MTLICLMKGQQSIKGSIARTFTKPQLLLPKKSSTNYLLSQFSKEFCPMEKIPAAFQSY